MTFTILGRDPVNGQLGIGIATYSLAVGATCPRVLPGVCVLTTQASTNPAIGEQIVASLRAGADTTSAFNQAVQNDPHPGFRQVALLAPTGDALVHSGADTKPFSGHVNGENCTAVGNFLAGVDVLEAMTEGFGAGAAGTPLAERLLIALEAGKAAGGQVEPGGTHLAERSACLVVATPGERFPIDTRVDYSTDAIPALRESFGAYRPMHGYYLARAENPVGLPLQFVVVNDLKAE